MGWLPAEGHCSLKSGQALGCNVKLEYMYYVCIGFLAVTFTLPPWKHRTLVLNSSMYTFYVTVPLSNIIYMYIDSLVFWDSCHVTLTFPRVCRELSWSLETPLLSPTFQLFLLVLPSPSQQRGGRSLTWRTESGWTGVLPLGCSSAPQNEIQVLHESPMNQ